LNLDFTKITSPVEGIVGIAVAQIGDLVGPTTGDLTAVSTVDPIKVYFTIPEQTYISYYKKFLTETGQVQQDEGMELELILADGTVFPHKGKISAVGRHVTPETGTIRIEALFPNPGNVLRPGQFSRVHAKLDVKKGAILVPQRAVNEIQGSYQVAVVNSNSQIEIRTVTPGQRIGNLWVIDEGLKLGDNVVVEGVSKVKPGMIVAPKAFNTSPPSEPVSPANEGR
jgi:membrane fusion protein (multidrug efflux system)